MDKIRSVIIFCASFLIGIVILLIIILCTRVDNSPDYVLNVVGRKRWQAMEPKYTQSFSQIPDFVIISHTATDPCFNETLCEMIVRGIQSNHMNSKNWSDIGYNFLVGGNGYVYEGRGWTAIGSHTKGYNSRSIGISLIGTFDKIKPSYLQLESTKRFIDYGLHTKNITFDYSLFGARQLGTIKSPGDLAYFEIQKWPHFSFYT